MPKDIATADRWQQASQIYLAALERDTAARDTFLREACAGDEGLRREVESLLGYASAADAWLERPAVALAAPMLDNSASSSLLIGRLLGPYKIVAPLGVGGMGEVYQAHDERLNRLVAIKVIAPHFVNSEQARERFEREARAIAALSHPNICTLYDVGSVDSVEFLVMEHLEGETLAARLARLGEGQALPLYETLHIATQLADALAAAHCARVIHRDLKPGNIMLTRSVAPRQSAPQVKVLDFGLAKLSAPTEESTTTPGALTGVETIVGTLPYMTPEQLGGREVDARTDLFAFGAIVYEMASGRPAFSGDSPAALIASILDHDPEPLASVQPLTTPGLERLVRKCLAKDPDARWQTASDVADELRWIAGGEGARGAAPQASGWYRAARWTATAIALLLAVVAGATIWWWRSAVRPRAHELQHRQVTFTGDVEISALSPDGRTVAYVPHGFDRVLVRELSGGEASTIWTHGVMALSWLPDGSHLVVIGDDRSVWIVPRLGGTARRVAGSGRMASPSANGASLALTADDLAGFHTISLADGETRVVTLTGFGWVFAIDWHARTNRVVLTTSGGIPKATAPVGENVSNLWSVASDGREQFRLLTGNEFYRAICSSPVSDVVYVMRDRDGSGSMDLLRVPMYPDPDAVRVLLTGLPPTMMGYRCSVSADGRRLLYGRRGNLWSLWRLNLARPTTQATPLRHGSQEFLVPAVAPDGLWIAGTIGLGVAARVVKIPIGGGEPVRLGDGAWPSWSPNGQQLAFTSRRSGSPRVWLSGANGEWPKEVKDSAVGGRRPIWLPDGRLAWQTPDRQNYRIRDLATGREEYLFKEASVRWVDPTFSPHGDQVVLRSYWDEAGLMLLSWPGREERYQSRSVWPIGWSADGEWIYAIQPARGTLVRVSPKTGGTETIGQIPAGLDVHTCDLTPDRDAIVCSLVERKSDAWLLENFDPEIR